MMSAMQAQARPHSDQGRRRNLRTALVLLSVALAFFAGIVLKYVLFP